MAEKPTSSWNSLEFAKLIVSVMTPVVVALVGFLISKQLAMQDLQWKGNQALVERRIKSYDTIKDELNRVHCFINDVGTWKEENPETIIACKRHMDQVMYTERAFWSPETFDAYLDYTNNAAFCPFRGVGQNAQIRTVDDQKKVAIPGWAAHAWSNQLCAPDPKYSDRYDRMYASFAADMAFAQPK